MMIVIRSWALRASAGLVATIAIADANPAGALSRGPAASLCAHVQSLVNGARLTREDGYALAALLLVLARGLAGRRRLAHHLLVELRPLFRFSAKFHPHWRPRSLLMRSWWEIAPVGAAALVAEFGRASGGVEGVGGLAEQPAPA